MADINLRYIQVYRSRNSKEPLQEAHWHALLDHLEREDLEIFKRTKTIPPIAKKVDWIEPFDGPSHGLITVDSKDTEEHFKNRIKNSSLVDGDDQTRFRGYSEQEEPGKPTVVITLRTKGWSASYPDARACIGMVLAQCGLDDKEFGSVSQELKTDGNREVKFSPGPEIKAYFTKLQEEGMTRCPSLTSYAPFRCEKWSQTE